MNHTITKTVESKKDKDHDYVVEQVKKYCKNVQVDIDRNHLNSMSKTRRVTTENGFIIFNGNKQKDGSWLVFGASVTERS